MKLKYLFSTTILIAASSAAYAQTAKEIAKKKMTDSMKMEGLSAYAIRYPMLRQGFIATDLISGGNTDAELNGNDLYKGKMNITRIRSNFKLPLAQWGKNALTGTVGYMQQRFQTKEITSFSPQLSNENRSVTKSTASFTVSFSRSDSLFNKQIFWSGGLSGITDEFSSIKRVNYIGTFSMPLKRTQTSSLTVGFVVILDPSSVSPFVPIISYWHKYTKPDLELFVDIPSRVAVRKQLTKKSWATLGSELGGTLSFFDADQAPVPRNSIYTNVEIRSGATFEYMLTKKVILGVNGGLFTTTSGRMFDRNDQPNDYFFKTTTGTVPYISFSVSLLPFLTKL